MTEWFRKRGALDELPVLPAYHLSQLLRTRMSDHPDDWLRHSYQLVEVVLQLVAVIAAVPRKTGNPSLPAAFLDALEVPSLGSWKSAALSTLEEAASVACPLRREALTELKDGFVRSLELLTQPDAKGDDPRTVFALRNRHAHAKNVNRALLLRWARLWRPSLEAWIGSLDWIRQLQLVVLPEEGTQRRISGPSGRSDPSDLPVGAFESSFFRMPPLETPGDVLAFWRGLSFPLWPLFVHLSRPEEAAGGGLIAYFDRRPDHRTRVFELVPPADDLREWTFGSEVEAGFSSLAATRSRARVRLFGEAPNRFVGRATELAALYETVSSMVSTLPTGPRLVFAHGSPGVGKSSLMARLAADLLSSPPVGPGGPAIVIPFRFDAGDATLSEEAFFKHALEMLADGGEGGSKPEPFSGGDASFRSLRDRLLVEPANSGPGGRPLVFVLDALDELPKRGLEFVRRVLRLDRPSRAVFVSFSRPLPWLADENVQGALVRSFELQRLADEDIRRLVLTSLACLSNATDRSCLVREHAANTVEFVLPGPLSEMQDLARRLASDAPIDGPSFSPLAFAGVHPDRQRLAAFLADPGTGWIGWAREGPAGLAVRAILPRQDFVRRLVVAVGGLPLVTRFFSRFFFEMTARSVGASVEWSRFYGSILERANADLPGIAFDVFGLVAAAHESLTAAQVRAALEHSGVDVGRIADPLATVRNVTAGLIERREPDGSELPSFALSHQTLREFLRAHWPRACGTAQNRLASLASLEKAPPLWRGYVVRHGVAHLLSRGRLADAVNLISELERILAWQKEDEPVPPSPAGQVPDFGDALPGENPWDGAGLPLLRSETIHSEAKAIADFVASFVLPGPRAVSDQNLRASFVREARALDVVAFARIAQSFYEVDPLYPCVRLLVDHHFDQWPAISSLFLDQDDMIVRYTMGEALASAVLDGTTSGQVSPVLIGEMLTEIDALAATEDPDRREVGLYAKKFLAFGDRSRLDCGTLRSLAVGPTCYDRGIAAEILLGLGLRGERVFELVPESPAFASFWSPIWDYNAWEIVDLRAVDSWKKGLQRHEEPHVQARLERFLEAEKVLAVYREAGVELTKSSLSETDYLASLISDFWTVPRRCVREAAESLDGVSRSALLDLVPLFLGHPSWDVREAVATWLARAAASDVFFLGLVDGALEHPDWKVRYGGVEAAWSYRTVDGGSRFLRAVSRCHADPCARVRGLCAENTANWVILSASIPEKRMRARQCGDYIRRWLGDTDIWPLENMYLLFQHLVNGAGPGERSLKSLASEMAEGVESRLLGPGNWWEEADRGRFLSRLERERLREPR